MGTSFAILRGYNLTIEERTASTYLGAMTGIGDDFFDLKEMNDGELKFLLDALLNDTYNVKVKKVSEKLFLNFYIKVIENTKQHEHIKHYISKVFKAQMMSLKQTSPDLTYDEIKEINLVVQKHWKII